MSINVIHPIPLMSISRSMAEHVYRWSDSIGTTAVQVMYIWYIEGPRQKIVVDSGWTAATMIEAGAINFTHIQTLDQGLARFGLKPSDIDLVIQTHLHNDHIGLAPAFTKARFLVQQAELNYHRNPPSPAVDPRPCAKELLDTLKWEVLQGDSQIAEGLKVIFTPGHTPGGQSVAVETSKGTAIIDSLCTTETNWNLPAALKARVPVLIPATHNDPIQAYDSLMKIKKMADIVIPIHGIHYSLFGKIP